jgi:AraC-like DNA-binding protein
MVQPAYYLDNISTLFNKHTNSKQASHEKKHVLLVEIRSPDKQQLTCILKTLGYIPVEIINADNNESRILKISNSCLIIVDVNKSNKHELYTLGVFDYISCPLIPQELTLRITHAIDYFETAQAPLYTFTSASKACLKVAAPLIKQKAMALALATNTAAYLQTKLSEDIKLSELIVKMGTNRNQLNDAFKTSYGLTVFAWLLKKRMSLAQKLLKATTLSILQVGDQVGYPDSNNFSTAFKREYKLSPRDYRQS